MRYCGAAEVGNMFKRVSWVQGMMGFSKSPWRMNRKPSQRRVSCGIFGVKIDNRPKKLQSTTSVVGNSILSDWSAFIVTHRSNSTAGILIVTQRQRWPWEATAAKNLDARGDLRLDVKQNDNGLEGRLFNHKCTQARGLDDSDIPSSFTLGRRAFPIVGASGTSREIRAHSSGVFNAMFLHWLQT